MLRFLLLLATVVLCGCGSNDGLETLNTREVTLPDGKVIRAEAMLTPVDMQRGMMYRESLAPDRGMLFVHSESQAYRYWMYQVRIPLDIIFMDNQRRVLGVSADTPPCKSKASECPNYGGYPGTRYVLEMGGGEARKHGIQPGSVISF